MTRIRYWLDFVRRLRRSTHYSLNWRLCHETDRDFNRLGIRRVVLRRCCHRVHPQPAARPHLSEMTFIDTAGKAFLAAMHRQGAEFIAANCLTRAVVAEIAKATFPTEGVKGAKAKVSHN